MYWDYLKQLAKKENISVHSIFWCNVWYIQNSLSEILIYIDKIKINVLFIYFSFRRQWWFLEFLKFYCPVLPIFKCICGYKSSVSVKYEFLFFPPFWSDAKLLSWSITLIENCYFTCFHFNVLWLLPISQYLLSIINVFIKHLQN